MELLVIDIMVCVCSILSFSSLHHCSTCFNNMQNIHLSFLCPHIQTRYLRPYIVLAVVMTVHIRMIITVMMALCVTIDHWLYTLFHYASNLIRFKLIMKNRIRTVHDAGLDFVSHYCFLRTGPRKTYILEYNAVVVSSSISFQASSLMITVPPWKLLSCKETASEGDLLVVSSYLRTIAIRTISMQY